MEFRLDFYKELLHIDWLAKCGEAIQGLYDFEIYKVKDLENAIKTIS